MNTTVDLVRRAAANNADLYEVVCAAHGGRTERNPELLTVQGPPPRYYGNAVILSPGARDAVARANVNDQWGAFKDSFADLSPNPQAYKPLFTAQWIWREPYSGPAESNGDWRRVVTDAQLRAWEHGWAANDPEAANYPPQFPASLLANPLLAFYDLVIKGNRAGGVLINRSPSEIGISNAYATGIGEDELWNRITGLVDHEYPNIPATGFLNGSELDSAIKAGFRAAGNLIVWVRTTV